MRSVDFPHAWVLHPIAAAAGAFMKTLAAESPIPTGTPDPYTPPKPEELRPERHVQLGPIIQEVTQIVRADVSSDGSAVQPDHGIPNATG